MKRHLPILWVFGCFFIASALLLSGCVQVPTYLKMDPPADSDKPLPVPTNDNSCWLHTAANMLAGAGYGNGTTLEERADDIWGDMDAHFQLSTGGFDGGWTDAALQWWLNSSNNTWSNNPYTVVTVYGNKSPKYPWANTNGAMDIANHLRECNFVGLSISWPQAGSVVGSGGHAITAWGDSGDGRTTLSSNPQRIIVTDSDKDDGGDVQTYTYDAYNNPNPGAANEGNGWYFDYSTNHPYIKHIVTLTPTEGLYGTNAVMVTGSIKIQQNNEQPASDLHYHAYTDVNVLTYYTSVDQTGTLDIKEDDPRRGITVDYIFAKEIPFGTWVTITTEFVESAWNAISYENVYFTYENLKYVELPELNWRIETPNFEYAELIQNVTGGYVVGAFEIYDPANPDQSLMEYRFVHQYLYDQTPELHTFTLSGGEGYTVRNIRFTHVYGYPTINELWEIEKEWMTVVDDEYTLGDKPIEVTIDWRGLLPYPEGDR